MVHSPSDRPFASILPPGRTPPHCARLVRRLAALDGPLVQVWAWPGSGANGLLSAFCAAGGEEALALPASLFAGAERAEGLAGSEGVAGSLADAPAEGLEEAWRAARSRGCRWFVALAPTEAALDRALLALAPGERLLFAGPRRLDRPRLEVELLGPRELLLEAGEIRDLWERLLDAPASEGTLAGLRAATDGWYRPLSEILIATGGAGLDGAEAEDLAALPGVRGFLRHEVLSLLSAAERDRLVGWAAAEAGSPAEEASDESESLGLWIEEGSGMRLPRLLAAYLARESRKGRQRPRHPDREAAPAGGEAKWEAGFSVSLFGTPAIRRLGAGDGDDRQVECRLRRSLQALAFLSTSADLRANRDDLVGAIWPNEGERTIERNFHPTLSHLRRSLEGAPIVYRGGVYQLNPALRWEIDTRDFLALVESGRRATMAGDLEGAAGDWREAWKLYRGPFMQGFFDLWVAERRELLQQQYLELLRDFGDLCVRLERPAEAMDAYRAVLVEDPLQERVQVAVMRLYAAQGRRDLVKRQYDRLCSLLVEELGVAPLAQTTEDYHLLMG